MRRVVLCCELTSQHRLCHLICVQWLQACKVFAENGGRLLLARCGDSRVVPSALPLVKKIFLAAISNIASPLWNATLMTSLQAVDVVVFVVCTLLSGNWGHRDRCVKRETFAFLQQKKRETFAFRKLAQSQGKSISTATDCEEL